LKRRFENDEQKAIQCNPKAMSCKIPFKSFERVESIRKRCGVSVRCSSKFQYCESKREFARAILTHIAFLDEHTSLYLYTNFERTFCRNPIG
jgi:hypothetical protein